MNKKIVTFTMSALQSQFEVERLSEEARKLGVEVNKALYRELSFDLNKDQACVFIRGEEINENNTLGMWFRVAGTKSGKYTEGRNLAIRILKNKVFCVNHGGYLGWARMGKTAQHGVFLENGIPIVPTKIFYTKEQVAEACTQNLSVLATSGLIPSRSLRAENLGTALHLRDFPIIVKHEKGYQGKSVRKFESWKEVEKWLNKIDEKNLGMFLWQKYLPTRWDIRVIVLGGKAIGAMKRSAVGKEFRSNYSLGGAVEKWDLSAEDKDLAEKVVKVCELDYGGVDIMKDEQGKSYVLEVNRQCQFRGFEMATGINVAKKVVEMIVEKRC